MYPRPGWFASAARVVCIFRLGGLHLPRSGPLTPQQTDSHHCTRPPSGGARGILAGTRNRKKCTTSEAMKMLRNMIRES